MPGPKHLKITAGGQLVPGEVWTCTFALGYDGTAAIDPAVLANVAGRAAFFWSTFFQVSEVFSQTVRFQLATVRSYNDAGLLIGQSEASPEGGVSLGTGPLRLPPQCATVLSLSGILPGASRRGRLYLPTLALVVGSNGRIQSTVQEAILNAAQTGLDLLCSEIETLTELDAVTIAVASTKGAGMLTPVTRIRVGDVVDTQRRRRDALPEAYISATLGL